MKYATKYLLATTTAALVGCGGDTFDFDTSGSDDVLSTNSYNVYVPEGMDTITAKDSYFDGFVLGAGSSLASLPSAAVVAEYSDRDVVAFIAERDPYSSEIDAEDVIGTIESALNLMGNASAVFKQDIGTGNEIIATYVLTTYQTSSVTEVATSLMEDVALESDSETGELETPPEAASGEALTTDFQVYVGVFYEDSFSISESDNVLILAAVVPADIANAYSSISRGVTSTSSVSQAGDSIVSDSETFTASGSTDLADFLFVIDNSGSMSDDQDAISQAVDSFVNVISTSGLDARFGTITTDSSVLRDSNTDGGFTSSTTELKLDVKPGTSGSATETGIYFAEQALLDTTAGDSSDGSVTTEGYPRANASMSIIILSDEDDQYSSLSGGVTFDTADNLFIDRNYQVYSIVDTSYYGEDYIDLSNATFGSYADITNLSAFDTIMQLIALNAGSASSRIVLAQPIIRNTLEVRVNGNLVVESSQNGWQYNEGLRTLAFFGTAKPEAGDSIKVNYEYVQTAE